MYSSGISFNPLTSGSISLYFLNMFLTILSSREWNVITAILPPFLSLFIAFGRMLSSTVNSSLTSILNAWNIFLSGWFL